MPCTTKLSEVKDVQVVEDRCRLTETPMLGSEESLKAVIDADTKTLESLGLTHDQLADFMEDLQIRCRQARNPMHWSSIIAMMSKLFGKAADQPSLDDFILPQGLIVCADGWCLQRVIQAPVGPFTVTQFSWGGSHRCPFQISEDKKYYGYEYGADDILVERDGKYMKWGSLLPHIIRQHHFFEGPSSKYRVDPEEFARFFDLQAGVDYKTPSHLETRWCHGSSSSMAMDPPEEWKLEEEKKISGADIGYYTDELGKEHLSVVWKVPADEKLPEFITLYGARLQVPTSDARCTYVQYAKREKRIYDLSEEVLEAPKGPGSPKGREVPEPNVRQACDAPESDQ
uniref:Uncharacterized protein n=1 Tax=viral metagenome TaxID=1070528 RepID=A0A6C0BNV8_9ZZZZ